MSRTLFINIIRALAAAWCIRAGGLLPDLFVLLLAVHSASLGLYQIKHIDDIRIFNNRPQYFLNFSIGFNLMFPAALAALLLAREIAG